MKQLLCGLTLCLISFSITGQETYDLSYYLPDVTYDERIPTPKEFLGHEVGEWHVTHDKLYFYMKELAEKSDRIVMTEYARSHEHRPLVYLTVTSPKNHNNIDDIRAEHVKLTDTEISEDVDISDMPIVIYQGSSIHGNEPSGSNGALAMAYYLAAAQGDRIEQLLDESVILFDPCYNPDGLNRFASWANTHKGKHLIADGVSREYNEMWPRGRTNHYWFDLNRDWLLLTHPESRGRINTFHQWKPDILTDHHEMGTNSTFFFQPGIPSRTNPNTPALNQELTYKIAEFHGRALDKIGSLYYTKESFDDYYYGKGSTYPDAQGAIGILFEQASSRGHLQDTDNGLMSFPFTIRNQVTTMFSTQDAGVALRKEILEYKRQSFLEARKLAKKNPVKGYVFTHDGDKQRMIEFFNKLPQHDIDVYRVNEDYRAGGSTFSAGSSYYVPLAQDQYRLVKTIFEQMTTFEDSLFYDVSAWTLPLAANMPYAEVKSNLSHEKISLGIMEDHEGKLFTSASPYAYLIEWHQYLAPRALKDLLEQGVVVKQANESFTVNTSQGEKTFGRGTLIIPTGNNQTEGIVDCDKCVEALAAIHHVDIYGITTGLVSSGVNLGSRSLGSLSHPKPLILIGSGVNSYDAGEVWHHFDQVLEMPVPMVDIKDFRRVDLTKYNTIIMPDGSYNSLNSYSGDLKKWVQAGGNIVAIKGAINWLKTKDIISIDNKTSAKSNDIAKDAPIPAYADANEERGAKFTGGMIAMTDIDLTHPLFYGYSNDQLPIFKRGNNYYKPIGGKVNTPARYSKSPVLSGYLHQSNKDKMPGAAAVFSAGVGRGKVIGIVDNPLHRGYWYGGHRLFANAVFFGATIN